jgi:hypothetical protein
MSTRVIELNDSAIKLGDESGVLISSPGFALADDKIIHLGEEAERQARLKPTSSFNKYWHELSLEPYSGAGSFRHYADIAHAQLMHLAEHSGSEGEVIFAVPGSFSQQQLAILLGIAQQTPLRPVGVVDSALAAAIVSATAERIIYVDMQLHQVVLTRLLLRDEELESEEVIQIPGVGSQNFMDLLMQLSTDLFIQQCRFNPQHNAESEQQLYNALPAWLRQEENEQGSLVVELNSGGNVHTAKLPREELVASLSGHYRKIDQQIQALLGDHGAQLLLNPNMAALPGLNRAFNHHADLVVVDDQAVLQGSLRSKQHIALGDAGIRRIKRLPVHDELKLKLDSQPDKAQLPTHVLLNSQAWAAADLTLLSSARSGQGQAAGSLALNLPGLPEVLARLERRGSALVLSEACEQLRLNAAPAEQQVSLKAGDTLSFEGQSLSLDLIRVHNV